MALGSIQGSLDDGEADTGDGDRPDVLGGEHEVQQAEDQRGVVGAQRRNAPRTAASGSPGGVFHDQEGFTTRGSSKVFVITRRDAPDPARSPGLPRKCDECGRCAGCGAVYGACGTLGLPGRSRRHQVVRCAPFVSVSYHLRYLFYYYE